MKPAVVLIVLLALASNAWGQTNMQSDASSDGPWVRYPVSEDGCGLRRNASELEISILVLKNYPHMAVSVSSPQWDLSAGQFRVQMRSGHFSREAFVQVTSKTSLFLELPEDDEFRRTIATTGVLTLMRLPLDTAAVEGGELDLPFDNGAQALELLAECGIPAADTIPLQD